MSWNNVWHHADWIALGTGILGALSTIGAVWAAYKIGKKQSDGLLKQDIKGKVISRIDKIIEDLQGMQFNAQKQYDTIEDIAEFNLIKNQTANRFVHDFMIFQCELNSFEFLLYKNEFGKIERWKGEMKTLMDAHNSESKKDGIELDAALKNVDSIDKGKFIIVEYGEAQKPLIQKMFELYTLILKV
jgi:hypothetical protein